MLSGKNVLAFFSSSSPISTMINHYIFSHWRNGAIEEVKATAADKRKWCRRWLQSSKCRVWNVKCEPITETWHPKDKYQSAHARCHAKKRKREKSTTLKLIHPCDVSHCLFSCSFFGWRFPRSRFSVSCFCTRMPLIFTVEVPNHRNIAKAKTRNANNVWHLFVYGKHNRRRQRTRKGRER